MAKVLSRWLRRTSLMPRASSPGSLRSVSSGGYTEPWVLQERAAKASSSRGRSAPTATRDAIAQTAGAQRTLYAPAVQQTRAASTQTKVLLAESQLPRRWYNIPSDQ